jgi:hypothetical protein
MSTELVQQSAEAPQNPVAWAIANNVSPEQMLQYYQLDREMKADAARNAFNEAFAAFKAESVSVVKNITVTDGPLKGKKYADLFGVVSAVTPVLAKHGLSHSWKLTRDEKEWMEVTCIIRHSLGHSESVSMGAAPDTGPGRNAIQARGSAKSYLERYTLLGATGHAASGQDDDGNAAGRNFLATVVASMKAETDPDKVVSLSRVAYKTAKDNKDTDTCAVIITAKDARLKELVGE